MSARAYMLGRSTTANGQRPPLRTQTPNLSPLFNKQASIAELHYACKATELGIELHFHGLSQRLLTLVELVLRRLLHFAPHLEEVSCRRTCLSHHKRSHSAWGGSH